jgi:LCP family protein required for cell wall assembly
MAERPFERPEPRRPRHPGLRKAFLITTAVLGVLVTGGSAVSITSIHHFEGVIVKIPVGPSCSGTTCLKNVDPVCINKACNFLVLGSDSRAGLSPDEQSQFGNSTDVQGQRADSIIVVQTDVKHDRTIVLSIPRDLRVEVPGHGTNKINTAFSYGPDVMVQAVEKLTGLHINHYVSVDFVGFQNIVNALGGVPVCVEQPMVDAYSGLNLPKAGCYNLQGAQALAFVRARHVKGDVIPDFSRIARQQLFIRAVIQKSMSIGAITHYPALINSTKKNLVVDANLNLYDLQDLTLRLAELGQQGVDFRVVPARPVEIDGVDYLETVQPQADQLFEKIRKGLDLGSIGKVEEGGPTSPATVDVKVLDANSGGKAQDVLEYLQQAGFAVAPLEEAPPELTKTQILWGHGSGKQEAVVGAYLTTLPALYDNQHTSGSEIVVVIGPNFKGLDL